jgi:hypothetical protein
MSASGWVWSVVGGFALAFLAWASWPLLRAYFAGDRIRIARRLPDGRIRVRELDTGEVRSGEPAGEPGSYRQVGEASSLPGEHGLG